MFNNMYFRILIREKIHQIVLIYFFKIALFNPYR